MKSFSDFVKESKRMTLDEWFKYNSEQFKKGEEENKKAEERAKNLKLPFEFEIYNEGPKNKDFKLTKYNFKKSMHDFLFTKYGDMVFLPLSPTDLRYEPKPTKENTKDFTKMPEVIKYVRQQIWISDKHGESYDWKEWNQIMDCWLKGLKPYIKHGKIKVRIEECPEDKNCKMILVVDDKSFNDDISKKIAEMENESNLETWKKEWELAEEARKNKEAEDEERRRKDAEAKKEYEEWEKSLSKEEQIARGMGYGPHHPYELSHPWDSPGCHTMWGWWTGD